MNDLRISTYAARGAMAPHSHENSSFTVVLSGSYQENIRGRSLEHKPGSMLFYPAGETHAQSFGPAGSRKLIFRPSAPCLEFLKEVRVPLAQAPFLAAASVRELARRVTLELQASDDFSSIVIEGTLLELVATFGRTYKVSSQREAIPGWLRECRAFLEEQPGTGVTHASLAILAGKHPVHLARAFRRAYGETIGDYQRRLRLDKAATLLREGRMPLSEVALECGFANQAHFSRSFKVAFATTPAHYRADRISQPGVWTRQRVLNRTFAVSE